MLSAQNNFYAIVVYSRSLHGIYASMIHVHIPSGAEIRIGERASRNGIISRFLFLVRGLGLL